MYFNKTSPDDETSQAQKALQTQQAEFASQPPVKSAGSAAMGQIKPMTSNSAPMPLNAAASAAGAGLMGLLHNSSPVPAASGVPQGDGVAQGPIGTPEMGLAGVLAQAKMGIPDNAPTTGYGQMSQIGQQPPLDPGTISRIQAIMQRFMANRNQGMRLSGAEEPEAPMTSQV